MILENFSKITSSQLDFIMMNESSINKENILMTFLYINSYIFFRPKINNEEVLYNPEEKPEAFFRTNAYKYANGTVVKGVAFVKSGGTS